MSDIKNLDELDEASVLAFFERIVRKASGDPDFTLPYWDWNVDGRRALPDAFQDTTSGLYDDTRNPDLNAGEPLPARDIDPSAAVQALIPADNQPRLAGALELAKEDPVSPPAVILHVEDVQSTAPPGVVFRVFLNQPKATAATDPDEANYVGSIALFQSSAHGQGHKEPHKGPQGETFSFNITRLVQNLKKRGRYQADVY